MLSRNTRLLGQDARCEPPRASVSRLACLGSLVAIVWVVSCGVVLFGNAPAYAQESSREATLFFSDVVNYQNAGEFDLAADEWKKFIEKYPSDPLVPKAQNYLAVCQLQLKKFADATTNFETVLKKYPQADFREEAMLNLASANYAWAQSGNPGKYAEAAKRFADLLNAYPQSDFADQATYFMAESQYLNGRQEEAIGTYGLLAKKYPQSQLAPDAVYAMGVTQEELKRYAEAEKHSISSWPVILPTRWSPK